MVNIDIMYVDTTFGRFGLLLRFVNFAALLDRAGLACKQIQVNREALVYMLYKKVGL